MEARGTESTREAEAAKGLKKHLWEIFQRKSVPSPEEYLKKVRFVSNLLDEGEPGLDGDGDGDQIPLPHAEPRRFYPKELIIDYHRHPEIIYDLTWTPDDGAEEGSVQDMLDAYLDVEDNEKTYLFSGHRTIKGRYNLRANERYVQIHNPNRFIIASIKLDRGIDLDRDILELNYRRDLQNIQEGNL